VSIGEEGRRIEKRKRIISPNPNQGEEILSRGVSGVGNVVRRHIFRGTPSRRRMEKAKQKRRIPRMLIKCEQCMKICVFRNSKFKCVYFDFLDTTVIA